ncbi:MAG: efflux RND transporter periplasmic adaptor subunit [Candidatus Zixiibacteriota bacterium]
MKKNLRNIALTLIVVLGLFYIVINIKRSSPEMDAADSPVLSQAPARVYGTVEPEGREVFLAAPMTRQVIAIYVSEGDTLEKGQMLCTLENEVEKAQFAAALARVDLSRKALAISKDKFIRNISLYKDKAITEYEYTQSKLKMELDSLDILTAEKEAELDKAKLDQLDLKSPIDGIVYKFDVRLGESLPERDNSQIILGKPDLWVRLYVEAFWMERIKIGDAFQIKNAETNETIGTGTVISKTLYLGGKVFRTNDPYERFDTKYQEVILKLKLEGKNIPLGLSVLAEIQPDNR